MSGQGDGTFRGEMRAAIDAALRDTGVAILRSPEEVAVYAEQQAFFVAQSYAANEPGLPLVRQAAIDAVALYAAVSVVEGADRFDARLRGIADAALRLGSLALARAMGVPA